MRDYGKLYSTFWTSDTTRELTDQGKLLALYLLLGPHSNMIGCYRLPDGYVVDDLGWSKETVSKGFGELFQKGFVTRDQGTKWLFIRRYLKWNPIENPNQGKAAARLFEMIPASFDAKLEVAWELSQQGDRFPDAVLEPFRKGFETLTQTVSKPGTGTGTGTGTGEREDVPRSPEIERHEAAYRPTPEGFAEWFAGHPNKTKKQRAIEAWKLLEPDAKLRARIMAGQKRWLTSQQWADGKIELAANWLTEGLYDEEPEQAKRKPAERTKAEAAADADAMLKRARKAAGVENV